MERLEEVKEKIGADNYKMIIGEIDCGRMSKQTVQRIGLKMDPQVNGVYKAKHLELDLADVMRMMMDKWWLVKLYHPGVDGEDELYRILSDEDLGLQYLANRMRPEER